MKSLVIVLLLLASTGLSFGMAVDNDTEDGLPDTCATADRVDAYPFAGFVDDVDEDAVYVSTGVNEPVSMAVGVVEGGSVAVDIENSAGAPITPTYAVNGLYLIDPLASGSTCITFSAVDNVSYEAAIMSDALNEFEEDLTDYPDTMDDAKALGDDADVFGRLDGGDGADWFRIESNGSAVYIHGGGVEGRDGVAIHVFDEDHNGPKLPESVGDNGTYGRVASYALADGTWYVQVAMSEPGDAGAYYFGVRGNRAASGSTDAAEEPEEGLACASVPGNGNGSGPGPMFLLMLTALGLRFMRKPSLAMF